MTSIQVSAAGPGSWPDVERVLDQGGQVRDCWCMWFRLSPTEWRKMSGADNRGAMQQLVETGTHPGLVAYRAGEPIGWCALAPRSEYPKLTRSRVARPVDDAPVWSLVCLYVVPGNRGAGVARELVRAACAHARDGGARILEAYPVDDTAGPVSSDEAYHGVVSLLSREGFTEVARHSPRRPLMRREVGGAVRPYSG